MLIIYPINISSFGYLSKTNFGFVINAVPIVKGPTLPINIVIVKTTLPIIVKLGVIPVDNPVFPKADTISNRV